VRAELDVTLVRRIDETLEAALEPRATTPAVTPMPPPWSAPSPELRAA
jgi:hypothetical protein